MSHEKKNGIGRSCGLNRIGPGANLELLAIVI